MQKIVRARGSWRNRKEEEMRVVRRSQNDRKSPRPDAKSKSVSVANRKMFAAGRDSNELPPPLPRPKKKRNSKTPPPWATRKDGEGRERSNSYAWQDTDGDFADNGDDGYNWEYFLDSGGGGGVDREFDELFNQQTPRGDEEYTYDHYYESDAYTKEEANKKDRSCVACRDLNLDRTCEVTKCVIS